MPYLTRFYFGHGQNDPAMPLLLQESPADCLCVLRCAPSVKTV